ncbi:o-succinylbenzoate synthase [Sutcliffiella halmapala]
MKIKKIEMFLTQMELLQPFRTHIGTVSDRESILLKMTDMDGVSGWGEVVAFSSPWYTEETIQTSWHMLEDFFIPCLIQGQWEHPSEIHDALLVWKGNPMARAGLEMAGWDLFAKKTGKSLAAYIGGTRKKVDAGVVVSVDSPSSIIEAITLRLKEGYRRVKVKIDPGHDFEMLHAIRREFPQLALIADANSAYTLDDVDRLRKLDELQLMMIEQPLASDDIVEHAELQKQLNTPICLDESIVSYQDAVNAIKLGSCQVINIKIGRVGGLTNAIRIHDLCRRNGLPVWCGGMLETGISRSFNIGLASLPNFTIPGDISASSRYWKQDVIEPEVVVTQGKITVPTSPGIGYRVNERYIKEISAKTKTFQNESQ